jgi:AcrR family transcriptional regulator
MISSRMTTEEDSSRPTPQPPTVAGRRLVVVDAFIDLALEGRAAPTPEAIADRAGVSRATFFRYFSTLVELRGEAAARVMERFPELFTIPDLGSGSLDERIQRFVDARVQLHETLHPLELLVRAHAARDADTSDFVDAVRQVLADQARQHFAADLRPHGPARRDDLVTTIAVLTSVESWQQFRRSHDRSPVQTRRAWRTALAGILIEPRGRSVPGASGDHDDAEP